MNGGQTIGGRNGLNGGEGRNRTNQGPLQPFNGFENRGDHQAHCTLRKQAQNNTGAGHVNEEVVCFFARKSRLQSRID